MSQKLIAGPPCSKFCDAQWPRYPRARDGWGDKMRRPGNAGLGYGFPDLPFFMKFAHLLLHVVSVICLCLLLADGCRAESLNFAGALRWQGYIDTDLAFSDFINSDHTVAFRFMPQYAMIAEAPVLSVNGEGGYAIGIGGYRANGTNAVKLLVRVGNSSAYYSFGNPAKDGDHIPLTNEWHTMAVSKSGNTVRLFFDGKHRQKDGGGDLQVTISDLASINGTLRIGRESTGDAQFYGLVDDVVVLGKALTEDEVASLFSEPRLHQSVESFHLIRGWTFDETLPSGNPLPSNLTGSAHMHVSAYLALVSLSRDNDIDHLFLPAPYQKANFRLPFAPGVSWLVEQPYQGLASHNDYAAFSLDLIRGELHKSFPNSETCGSRVFASSGGMILNGCDLGDPPVVQGIADLTKGCAGSASQFASDGPLIDGFDWVRVQALPDENYTYMHLLKGSLREAFPDHPNQFHSPVVTGPPPNIHIEVGRWMGEAGTRGATNCHLHFSTGNSDVSFPIAFEVYEYEETGFGRWLTQTGAPQAGQFVRVPPNPKPAQPNPADCATVKQDLSDALAERQAAWRDAQQPNTSPSIRHTDAQRAGQLTTEIDHLQTESERCK